MSAKSAAKTSRSAWSDAVGTPGKAWTKQQIENRPATWRWKGRMTHTQDAIHDDEARNEAYEVVDNAANATNDAYEAYEANENAANPANESFGHAMLTGKTAFEMPHLRALKSREN